MMGLGLMQVEAWRRSSGDEMMLSELSIWNF